jgi:Domain of unknown function (DUF4129)
VRLLWDAEAMRGSRDRGTRDTARLVAAAVVVLGALALVALAARSDRAATITPRPIAVPTSTLLPPAETSGPRPDGGTTGPAQDTSTNRMPSWLLWTMATIAIAPFVLAPIFLVMIGWLPRVRLLRLRRRKVRATRPPEVEDEVPSAPLAAAVEEGLRELDQGGPGDGVVASWVLLERAAADAGTHRAAPDTPSELAGRLIDRHAVSSGPLLRLADLYREARFSRHELPEAARTEARQALERLRRELEASPVGRR